MATTYRGFDIEQAGPANGSAAENSYVGLDLNRNVIFNAATEEKVMDEIDAYKRRQRAGEII
jgi:hypothetical protein